MCLAVYIGTTHPLRIAKPSNGGLGVEKAAWAPSPLSRMEHVYYAGRKVDAATLECSCLLHEYVVWSDPRQPPVITSDDLYPVVGPCPFDALRAYCEQVLDLNGEVIVACDDSGGLEQNVLDNDYDHAYLLVDDIRRGRLIFASSAAGDFPMRAFTVLRPGEVRTNPLLDND
jgi:hypothetical protein